MEGTKCNAQSVSLRIMRELNFVTNVDTNLMVGLDHCIVLIVIHLDIVINITKSVENKTGKNMIENVSSAGRTKARTEGGYQFIMWI